MDWIFLSIIVAGCISGFFAGASPSPTGGGLASAIAGVIVGIIAGISQSKDINPGQIQGIGKLFLIFQLCLFLFYIIGNILRKYGYLNWMGIHKSGKDISS